MKKLIKERKFVAYFKFVSWSDFSLGFSINLSLPNIELHIPFGFIKIGWIMNSLKKPMKCEIVKSKGFGLIEEYQFDETDKKLNANQVIGRIKALLEFNKEMLEESPPDYKKMIESNALAVLLDWIKKQNKY